MKLFFAIFMAIFCAAANAQYATTVMGGDKNYTVDLSKSSPWTATNLYAETTGTLSERVAALQDVPSTPTLGISDSNVVVSPLNYGPNTRTAEMTGSISDFTSDLVFRPHSIKTDYNDPSPVLLYNYGDDYTVSDGVYTFKADNSTVSYNQDKSTLTVYEYGELLYNGYSSFYANGITVTMKSDQVSVVVNISKQTFEIKRE